MFPAGKSTDARAFDKQAMEAGVSSLILMENAAFSLYLEARTIIDDFSPDNIVLFAGRGGNGGDGFALLRILKNRGITHPLSIVQMFDPTDLSGDPRTNYRILPEDVSVIDHSDLRGRPLIIDAMLGTGISRDLSPKYKDAVQSINEYPIKKVLSVDVPTGINSDTGDVMGDAVYADVTVSFGIMKTGLYCNDGVTRSGRLIHGRISAPEPVAQKAPARVLEDGDIISHSPAIDAYKNKNGHALFIAGDKTKQGAIFIAARAFMASGGGLATVAMHHEDISHAAGRHTGIMLENMESLQNRTDDFSVMVAGPGLTEMTPLLRSYIAGSTCPLILDAGMIDAVSQDDELRTMISARTVIFTPHPGELHRFMTNSGGTTGTWLEQIHSFPLEPAHVLYAKNTASFIRRGDDLRIVPHGARALSFGGTGDALTGIAATALCRVDDPLQAASQAGLLHRRAGIILARKYHAGFHDIDKLIDCIADAMNGAL